MPLAPTDNLAARRRRGGFTFIEVMFAVMILGFGVIMIAAMLPVALRQTQDARETVAGSAVVEGGFHTLEDAYAKQDDPRTLGIYTLPDTTRPGDPLPEAATYPSREFPYAFTALPALPVVPLFYYTLGDRVSSSDAATAFVPFYMGDGGDSPRVTLLGVGARNVAAFADPAANTNSFLRPGAFFTNPDNCPLPVTATMNEKAIDVGGRAEQSEPDTITLEAPPTARANVSIDQIAQAAVEGAAVVLRNQQGVLRVYRLSKHDDINSTTSEDIWELTPGGDFTGKLDSGRKPVVGSEVRVDNNRDAVPVTAYLVGRMLKSPGDVWDADDNPYVGPTQVTQVLESQSMR